MLLNLKILAQTLSLLQMPKDLVDVLFPEWPREPVAPGETGVIDVKFNSKGKKGKQNKRVTLTTNMVPSQQVLIVKGQVNIKEE